MSNHRRVNVKVKVGECLFIGEGFMPPDLTPAHMAAGFADSIARSAITEIKNGRHNINDIKEITGTVNIDGKAYNFALPVREWPEGPDRVTRFARSVGQQVGHAVELFIINEESSHAA